MPWDARSRRRRSPARGSSGAEGVGRWSSSASRRARRSGSWPTRPAATCSSRTWRRARASSGGSSVWRTDRALGLGEASERLAVRGAVEVPAFGIGYVIADRQRTANRRPGGRHRLWSGPASTPTGRVSMATGSVRPRARGVDWLLSTPLVARSGATATLLFESMAVSSPRPPRGGASSAPERSSPRICSSFPRLDVAHPGPDGAPVPLRGPARAKDTGGERGGRPRGRGPHPPVRLPRGGRRGNGAGARPAGR